MFTEEVVNWCSQQLSQLTDLFFPRLCPVCLTGEAISSPPCFCTSCIDQIHQMPDGRCSRCALPFVAHASSSHLCADCLRHEPPFSSVVSAGLYTGTLKSALQRFKYAGASDLDRALGGLLQEQLPQLDDSVILVPVPLHPQRLRQRGFNQSLLIGRIVAQHLQIPVEKAMLVRRDERHTQQG